MLSFSGHAISERRGDVAPAASRLLRRQPRAPTTRTRFHVYLAVARPSAVAGLSRGDVASDCGAALRAGPRMDPYSIALRSERGGLISTAGHSAKTSRHTAVSSRHAFV